MAEFTLVPNWQPPPRPDALPLEGRLVRLEKLNVDHAEGLFEANRLDDSIWDYLPYGPFAALEPYRDWVAEVAAAPDPHFYAIQSRATGQWCGVASYLRIAPEAGSIEVGHINFAAPLQRSPAATEAMYLMMRWAFEGGYRRYEWKCDALNRRSRRAAERYGFSYEGIFRQAGIVKGRNRDTAWYAAIDTEWSLLQTAFEAWLAPENFDDAGRQRQSLAALTAPIRVSQDPIFANPA